MRSVLGQNNILEVERKCYFLLANSHLDCERQHVTDRLIQGVLHDPLVPIFLHIDYAISFGEGARTGAISHGYRVDLFFLVVQAAQLTCKPDLKLIVVVAISARSIVFLTE